MIDERSAKEFCKDEITKIENYEKAFSDSTQTWVIHHRLEFTLDGEFAHSRDELKRMDMYYGRPYFELIFLTKTEHRRLHMKGKNNPLYGKHHSDEAKGKMSTAKKGRKRRPFTEEHRMKLSESHKNISEETRRKLSEAHKGKTHSEETRKKMGESHKGHNMPYKGKTWKLINGKRVWIDIDQKKTEIRLSMKDYEV